MKGEYYVEEKRTLSNNSTSNMFAKFHQTTQDFQHHHQQQPPPPLPPSSFANNDGATIEILRRPRGRPPGSKNKPKPTNFTITRDHVDKPFMNPYIIEIPSGVEIINSINNFCMKQNMSLCILNGYGIVKNVTIKQPSTNVTFHGTFNILSISATIIFPENINFHNGIVNGFTITLAGPNGQVVGGTIVGPLLSEGIVYLIATTFNNPCYYKLPEVVEDDGGGQSSEVAVSAGEDSGPRESPDGHQMQYVYHFTDSSPVEGEAWKYYRSSQINLVEKKNN